MDINTCFATTEGIRTLAFYAHLIPAAAVLLLGLFVFWKAPNRTKAWPFTLFSLTFAAWLLSALIIWTSNSYHLVAALWAPIDFIEIVFFLSLFYFICVDLFAERVPRWIRPSMLLAAAVPFVYTIFFQNLDMQQPVCEMTESLFMTQYKLGLEVLILSATFLLGFQRIIVAKEWDERIRVALITLAVLLFMGIFSGTEYIATTTGVFEINLYALFTLPIFVLFLTTAITSYGTFRLGDVAIKALFYIFLILSATQFFFVNDVTSFLLALMSFLVILTLGLMLFRSNEREIAARHQIEELSNEKSEFMSFASHEIRNPITAMRGLSSLIYDGTAGEASKPVRDTAEKIMVTGNEVLALIAEFLDKAKIELGQIAYHNEVFDVGPALLPLAEGFKPSAELKGLTIETRIPTERLAITADKAKVSEVVGNIIDNSIKYTKQGSVTVSVEKRNAKILITIADTGVGIPQDVLPKLFKKFSRADAAKANLRGTGLGLFLAKNFVEGMNGKIWVESEEGKGSHFFIEFPSA